MGAWRCEHGDVSVGVRSHEDHGTKLTIMVSKINELITRDSCWQQAEGGCWQ